jgi:hypothetical protein
MRASRLPNTVARFGATQAREHALGVDHWAAAKHKVRAMHLSIGDALQITARLAEPMSAIDFRIYLPRLLEDYAAHGGIVEFSPSSPDEVTAWSERHELMVVASGRETVGELFPRDPDRSVHETPQRRLSAALYRGIGYAEPEGVVYTIVPGAGEIFTMPFLTFEGWVSALLIEAIPGGPLEPFARMPYDAGFAPALLELFEQFAPAIRERVDRATFSLTRPEDLLQGAITPTVRQMAARLETGRYALAIGDAWAVNDPVVAQGANLGSATAWIVGDAIRDHGVFDELFVADVDRRVWAAAQPAIDFTNAFLAAPPPHVLEILQAAAAEPEVADAFASRFSYPDQMWRTIATPERAAAFLRNHAGAAAV